jgi:hypothetical protein
MPTQVPFFRPTRDLKFSAEEAAAIARAERDGRYTPHSPIHGDPLAVAIVAAVNGLQRLGETVDVFRFPLIALAVVVVVLIVAAGVRDRGAQDPVSPVRPSEPWERRVPAPESGSRGGPSQLTFVPAQPVEYIRFIANPDKRLTPVYASPDRSRFLRYTLSGYWATDTHRPCSAEDGSTWRRIMRADASGPDASELAFGFICSAGETVAPEPSTSVQEAAPKQESPAPKAAAPEPPAPESATSSPAEEHATSAPEEPAAVKTPDEPKSAATASEKTPTEKPSEPAPQPEQPRRAETADPRLTPLDLEAARSFIGNRRYGPRPMEIRAEQEMQVLAEPRWNSFVRLRLVPGNVYFVLDSGPWCDEGRRFTWKQVAVPLPNFSYHRLAQVGFVCTPALYRNGGAMSSY